MRLQALQSRLHARTAAASPGSGPARRPRTPPIAAPRRPARAPDHAPALTAAPATPTSATTPTPTTVASPSPTEPFNWACQWYPVLCAKNAPGPGPHAVTLLGRDLVVWRDDAAGGAWACVDDACSHRLAPLSEGRVEKDGHLHCAYHGWAFDAAGACTRCPQAESAAALRTLRASPRSAVRAYPIRVEAGLVFVWPDAEPGAAGRAAAAPGPVLPTEVLDAAEKRGWCV
jgi:pheophorbide a oxygenase